MEIFILLLTYFDSAFLALILKTLTRFYCIYCIGDRWLVLKVWFVKLLVLVLPLLLPPQQDSPDEALDDVFSLDTAGVRNVPCHWELV